MNRNISILILSLMAFAILLAASVTAIILDDNGNPYNISSIRGQEVEIYGGKGLYQYDSVYKAVLFRGFDWANLVFGIPMLTWGIYTRRQLRGQLLLASVFTYLAYNYLIGVLGNSFNIMFLVWTALYSIGIFGLAIVLIRIDIQSFPITLDKKFPRKGLSVYVIILGMFLLFQYLTEIFSAFANGKPPTSLGIYTTLELAALELGIMIPLHILGGILLWKQKAVGYLLTTLLTFTAFMTFVALCVSSLIFFYLYAKGSVFDVVISIFLAAVAGGFSIAIFKQIKVDAWANGLADRFLV